MKVIIHEEILVTKIFLVVADIKKDIQIFFCHVQTVIGIFSNLAKV
jgi:hypothetical protein